MKSMDDVKQRGFTTLSTEPDHWYFHAQALRQVAAKIKVDVNQGIKLDPKDGELAEVFLFPVYKFLMGRSLEVLVKGLLLGHGVPCGSATNLETWFVTHYFSPKLEKLDQPCCKITSDERKVLDDLETYIFWAGTYPVSKTPEKFAPTLTFSQHEYETSNCSLEPTGGAPRTIVQTTGRAWMISYRRSKGNF